MFKSFFQHYFGFNKQQRNGLFVLMLISFSLLVVRVAYPYFIEPDSIQILNLPLVAQTADSASNHPWKNKGQFPAKQRREPFSFDPNTVSQEQLILLGFSEKQAMSFLKFRSKGVVFRKKEDLKKVFVVSDYLYNRLERYVAIKPIIENVAQNSTHELSLKEETRLFTEKQVIGKTTKLETVRLELNSADSAALIALPGIGPVIARRMIKYRNLLGGFVSTEQLREVFGISEELSEKLTSLVSIDINTTKKININSDEFKTLSRHPYLGYELTKRIFQERKKARLNGSELQALMADETSYRKLLPYLTFD